MRGTSTSVTPVQSTPPRLHRTIVPNVIIAAIIAGSILAIVAQRDYWPFSHYPMFAGTQDSELVIFEVMGIPVNGQSEEVSLAPSRRTSIVAGTRYQQVLALLVDRGTAGDRRTYLTALARRYAERQRADALPLRAVRLYRSRWQADPRQAPPVHRVDRTLLAEIELSGE